jgi:hypothetical protein
MGVITLPLIPSRQGRGMGCEMKKMPSPDKSMLLADEIFKILSKGLTLGSDVVQYIDSTFANPSIGEIIDILQDDTNCERDSLIELLFFPDVQLQYQLEELLENETFGKEDEKEVLDYLCRNPLELEFHFPGSRGSFSLGIPKSVAHQFIMRLNICKQIDQNLLLTIKGTTPAKDQNRFAVKLRNSRFAVTDKAVWFLSSFFKKWDTHDGDVFKYFDFILLFLEELQKEDDIFEALMKKKRFYLKHLKRAEKFEKQLKKTNMETLILKGQTAAFINMNEARENMAIIDRISLTVFAKTEHYETLFGPARNIEFRLK